MTLIEDVLDLSLLREMAEQKYVRGQMHPDFPEIRILNYTETATWENVWNDVTLQCRGLIYNIETSEVLARPFRKFFNYGQMDTDIPDGVFEVTDKCDGSLGISYQVQGDFRIATRGSFASDQAALGTELLHTVYAEAIPQMNPAYTYLFEVVGPSNRIVLEYTEHALILLSVVDIETGAELPDVPEIGFPVRKSYGQFSSLSEFAGFLPSGSARDDVREYLRSTLKGLEDVQSLQESGTVSESSKTLPRAGAEGSGYQQGVEKEESRAQPRTGAEELRQDAQASVGGEKRPVRGLRGSIPSVRDGLSSRPGREETQRRESAISESTTGGDSEVRGVMRELPPHQDVEGQTSSDDLIEGFVLHWHAHNYRLKMKTSDYVLLHKFLTNTSEKNVWEALSQGLDMEETFAGAPDEFHEWLKEVIQKFTNEYRRIEALAIGTHDSVREELNRLVKPENSYTRKQFAEELEGTLPEYRAMAFLLEDGRDIAPLIWKQIKPVGSTTFKKVDNEAD